jgi:DNA-binding NtrC family response regulator
MHMDVSPAAPVLPVEDAGSPASPHTAILSRTGQRVDTAYSGAGALKAYRPDVHRVVLLGLALPDGPEVTLSMLAMELRRPESNGRGDVVYAESSTGRVAGFAEPAREPGPEAPAAGDSSGAEDESAAAAEAFVGMSLAEIERLVIEATIRACGDSLPKAAQVLGVCPSTLYRKRAGWTD